MWTAISEPSPSPAPPAGEAGSRHGPGWRRPSLVGVAVLALLATAGLTGAAGSRHGATPRLSPGGPGSGQYQIGYTLTGTWTVSFHQGPGEPDGGDPSYSLTFTGGAKGCTYYPQDPCSWGTWKQSGGRSWPDTTRASVFVSRRGLLFSGAGVGNEPGFPSAVLTARAPNTLAGRLTFSHGRWVDQYGNSGSFTLTAPA